MKQILPTLRDENANVVWHLTFTLHSIIVSWHICHAIVEAN